MHFELKVLPLFIQASKDLCSLQTYFFICSFLLLLYSFTHFRIKRKKRERSIWLSSLLEKNSLFHFLEFFLSVGGMTFILHSELFRSK